MLLLFPTVVVVGRRGVVVVDFAVGSVDAVAVLMSR